MEHFRVDVPDQQVALCYRVIQEPRLLPAVAPSSPRALSQWKGNKTIKEACCCLRSSSRSIGWKSVGQSLATLTCKRSWAILPSSHPARRGDGFWWEASGPCQRPHPSFSQVRPPLPSCSRPICHICKVTCWEFITQELIQSRGSHLLLLRTRK